MRLLTHILVGALCSVLAFSFATQLEKRKHIIEYVHVHDTIHVCPRMSEWQLLQLAIMQTESRYNTKAEGGHGAVGVFQITPIYVEECNRILGREEFSHDDAYDLERSVQMFNTIQDYHNPEHDFQKAIKLHNPGGKAIGYPDKVVRNYNEIVKYERAREIVK